MKRNLSLVLVTVVLVVSAFAQDKMLTVDDIYHPQKKLAFSGNPTFGFIWSSDGQAFVKPKPTDKGMTFVKVDAVTGVETVFYDSSEAAAALVKIGVPQSEAGRTAGRFVAQNEGENSFLLSSGEDLFVFSGNSKTATRLTRNADEELEADFSPNGKMVSFVRGNDLFVVNVASGKETRLTKDGAKTLLNGYLAWVYEEELYGRGQNRGYWWSPDSASIVFLKTDDSMVPQFILADDTVTNQRIEDAGYPQAGDPNPQVTLHVADIATAKIGSIDTSRYQPEDFLVSRVDWSPDSQSVIWQGQNREQTYLDLNSSPAEGGKTTTLFRETSPAWIGVIRNPVWLKDGSFIWETTRDGYDHLYHYAANGTLIRQITKGNWEVTTFYGVNETKGRVYFSAQMDDPKGTQIYSIKLEGNGLERLTIKDGTWMATFDPTFNRFVAIWSDVNTPWQTYLYKADGTLEKVVNENKVDLLSEYKMSKPEFLQVKNRDGFEMEAMMIKPPDFDPSKKYPVLTYVYGGPHAPQVRDSWGGARYIWHQMLAQQGYIIWVLDPRSASGKSEKDTWTAYKQLGVTELMDLEDGIKFLSTKPWIDTSRIGIWGWSYGGFMTTYSLTHSDKFKMGVAGGTVSDWSLYDSIYTERYMLMPKNNEEGYDKMSVLKAAKNLKGKLLLIHGAMDNNVHMQNTTKLVYELQKAHLPFEMMIYPTQRHGVSNPDQVYHMMNMITKFVKENL